MTPVEELTGFPECLDGRVKTLHPRVHAGILADLRLDDHVAQLAELEIEPFDLVVVNLYPFRETVASGATPDECVEQIDIGGPSMVRAAAKNHPSVAVVVVAVARTTRCARPSRPAASRSTSASGSRPQAFAHTAAYDVAVASWFASAYAPSRGRLARVHRRDVGHVGRAALRREPAPAGRALPATGAGGLAAAEQLHGKEMSYNNYVDTDAARRAAYDFERPAVAIIKHANPCGIAVGADVAEAHARAHACDPVSAFGGVIATNRPVTRRDGRAGRRGLHRGHRRARLRARRRRGAAGQEEHPHPARPRRRARRSRSSSAASAAACCVQRVDHVDAEGDDPVDVDAGRRASRPTRRRSPTSRSRGPRAAP